LAKRLAVKSSRSFIVSARQKFTNSQPQPKHGLLDILRWQLGFGPTEQPEIPNNSLPPYQPESCQPDLSTALPNDRVRLTWIGHSTFLIQHRGRNLLTDPIFGNCQPIPSARLRRAAPPGIALAELPPIHDVLISHCHYDHLDAPAIKALGDGPDYWLPSGLSPWFHRRGLRRCRELAWWDSAPLAGGLEIHGVPAQHFAARSPFDRDRTHWCGWVLRSPSRTIYFAGDTGYCPTFKEIGERFGSIDLALIPIGAYRPRWIMQSIHVNPQEAVQIHLDVRARQSIASHWGTFRLTDEPLNEPPALLRQALANQSLPPEQFRTLRFGESIVI
jgi:N-acyl-phosphatidylethanolamine-hydrolysing phospholipase D